MDEIESAGGVARYQQLDVCNEDQVCLSICLSVTVSVSVSAYVSVSLSVTVTESLCVVVCICVCVWVCMCVCVSCPAQVKNWVEETAKAFGPANILVNNAAVFIFGSIDETSNEMWDRVFATNVKVSAPLESHCAACLCLSVCLFVYLYVCVFVDYRQGYAFCAKYAVQQMRRVGGGSIINIASVSSFIGQPKVHIPIAIVIFRLLHCSSPTE